MNSRHFKKRISLVIPKMSRKIRRDIFQMYSKMTREEREISAMIRNLLSNPENRIIYSIRSKSVRIQTRDKKYAVSLSSDHIRINFVSIPLNERIGNALVDRVIERMESDIDNIDSDAMMDQKEFLSGMNGVFIKTNTESIKRLQLVKDASSRNTESILTRILTDQINE